MERTFACGRVSTNPRRSHAIVRSRGGSGANQCKLDRMRKRLPATAHASREVSRTDQVKDPPSAVLRPLGAAEQLLWLLDHNSSRHFVLIAQIQGHIPIQGWRNAQGKRDKHERLCMERSAQA